MIGDMLLELSKLQRDNDELRAQNRKLQQENDKLRAENCRTTFEAWSEG